MADTIRKKILDSIADNLAGILIASGYSSNAGANLIIGDSLGYDTEAAAVVMNPGEETGGRRHRQDVIDMAVGIRIFIPAASLSGRAAQMSGISEASEAALGDIRAAMAEPVPLAEDVIYSSGSAGEDMDPDSGVSVAGAVAEYVVRYSTKINDPFSQ